jgi:hypothetical protein
LEYGLDGFVLGEDGFFSSDFVWRRMELRRIKNEDWTQLGGNGNILGRGDLRAELKLGWRMHELLMIWNAKS